MLAIHLANTLCWLMSRLSRLNCKSGGFFCKVNKYFLFMCQYLAYMGFFLLKKESCFISLLSLLALIAKISLQTAQISKSDLEEWKLLLTE